MPLARLILLNWNSNSSWLEILFSRRTYNCLNSVETLWTIDTVMLPGTLLLSIPFHIFSYILKWSGFFFIYIIHYYFEEQLRYDRRIPNWHIIRMHSSDIESFLSKKSALTIIKSICSYSLFKNKFRDSIFNVKFYLFLEICEFIFQCNYLFNLSFQIFFKLHNDAYHKNALWYLSFNL